MTFAVEQEVFSGPLGLLLDLLDKNELEIKDVSLAKITDSYLAYLDANDVPSEELADFLVVASRLIYIKSRELMPYLRIDGEEEQVASLEDQLRLYRLFSDAAGRLEERFASSAQLFARPMVRGKQDVSPKFLPAPNVSGPSLLQAFRSLLKRLEPFFALQQASIERVKSVEERLDELRGAITSRASMTFKEVVAGARSKAEVVVSFLALLELIRRHVVKAKQSGNNDIVIQKA